MTEPRFAHGCTVCHWLGQHDTYDLYFCKTDTIGVMLVARFGNGERMFVTMSLRLWRGVPEELPGPFRRAYELASKAGLPL